MLLCKQELGNTCISFPGTWGFTRKGSTHPWTSQGFSLSRQTRVHVSLASTKRWGLLSNNAINFIIFFQESCQPGKDKSFMGYGQLTWECYWTFDTPLVYLCLSCHQEWVLEALGATMDGTGEGKKKMMLPIRWAFIQLVLGSSGRHREAVNYCHGHP